MDIHGLSMDNPWISMDHPWISIDTHGYLWISMDIHGYPWISMDIHGYPWISMDDPWISMDDPWRIHIHLLFMDNLSISIDMCGLSMDIQNPFRHQMARHSS